MTFVAQTFCNGWLSLAVSRDFSVRAKSRVCTVTSLPNNLKPVSVENNNDTFINSFDDRIYIIFISSGVWNTYIFTPIYYLLIMEKLYKKNGAK